ncbi:MAG: BlaI/MecI/CopY family transcriptional regulator [Fimbriimonadales bacterium]
MSLRPLAKFEFDLIAYLSENNGKSVREIFEDFGQKKGYVRGTIVKGIDRLFRKGRVRRELKDGVFVYSAVQSRDELDRQLVESFVKDRLKGRLAPLAAFLAEPGSHGVSAEELKSLKSALDEALEKK